MGTINVEADLCITMSALRGNAAQDAPRPLWNVTCPSTLAVLIRRRCLDHATRSADAPDPGTHDRQRQDQNCPADFGAGRFG